VQLIIYYLIFMVACDLAAYARVSGRLRWGNLLRSLCRRMVCPRCGYIGADVRPDWSPHGVRLRINPAVRVAARSGARTNLC
jgi:hypothetical protein